MSLDLFTRDPWSPFYDPLQPVVDALDAVPPRMRVAQRNIQARHLRALCDHGVPFSELLRGHVWTFGVVTIQGREMLVTDDARLRGYITGPIMAAMPETI